MKTLSMFSKSIVMALGMVAVSSATISVAQAATPNVEISEAVAAAQSKSASSKPLPLVRKRLKVILSVRSLTKTVTQQAVNTMSSSSLIIPNIN